MLHIDAIGTHANIPGWPECDTIAGLLDALSRWELDKRLDYSDSPAFLPHPLRAPFRGPALRSAGRCYSAESGCSVYHYGDPMYDDAPDAVIYCGNFVGYSFGFRLATDDPALMAQLDEAIARNLNTAWAA